MSLLEYVGSMAIGVLAGEAIIQWGERFRGWRMARRARRLGYPTLVDMVRQTEPKP